MHDGTSSAAISVDDLRGMVDWERGLISPQIFVDQQIYELEMERLFGRTWLFLAHESQLKRPGDFFSTFMGADPVFVVRQQDGSIKAFFNFCRHRGLRVCRTDMGNAKAFVCPYHGWTYNREGALVSVPNFEDGYHGELEMDRWGLVSIGQVQSYRGLVFGNFDPKAPPLDEYLGDFRWYLDAMLDRLEGGTEFVAGVQKWSIPGNWKLAAEQFAGDAYHGGVSHASAIAAMMDGAPDGITRHLTREGRQFSSRQGHGTGFALDSHEFTAEVQLGGGVIADYYRENYPHMVERLGKPRARGPLTAHLTVFPNFSAGPGGAHIRLWHPKGPHAFEVWCWVIVDRDAPPEVKAAQARATMRIDSASGIVEQDDGENWAEMGRNFSTSHQLRKIPLNYQMGLGHDRSDDPDFPGRVRPHFIGELPQRGFYRRWLEFMTSDEWPEVTVEGNGVESAR